MNFTFIDLKGRSFAESLKLSHGRVEELGKWLSACKTRIINSDHMAKLEREYLLIHGANPDTEHLGFEGKFAILRMAMYEEIFQEFGHRINELVVVVNMLERDLDKPKQLADKLIKPLEEKLRSGKGDLEETIRQIVEAAESAGLDIDVKKVDLRQEAKATPTPAPKQEFKAGEITPEDEALGENFLEKMKNFLSSKKS